MEANLSKKSLNVHKRNLINGPRDFFSIEFVNFNRFTIFYNFLVYHIENKFFFF